MWFVFGLLTLVVGVVASFRSSRPGLQAGKCDGRLQHEMQLRQAPFRPMLLRIGIAVDPSLEFRIRPEGWLDRVAKRLGVVDEPQVGRAGFDQRFYIVSDDPRTRERLRGEAVLVDKLAELVEFDASFRFHQMYCRQGFLTVELRPVAWAVAGEESAVFWYKRRLEALADALPDAPASTSLPRDPYFFRTALILATSSGLLVGGMLNAGRMLFVSLPATIDLERLWLLSLPIAAALVLLLAVGTSVLLFRSSRAPLVLLEVLLLGSLGAVLSAFTGMRDLNISADDSIAQPMEARVLDRREHRGKRGRRSYSLILTDWTGESGTRQVSVGREFFSKVPPQSTVVVWQRPGYFGARWIEKLSLAQRQAAAAPH